MTIYSVFDIATFSLDYATKIGTPLSNLQLQKIFYFLQRSYLKQECHELFKEDFVAWPYGPVILNLYYTYCGNGPVPIKLTSIDDFNNIAEKDKSNIKKAIDKLSQLNPWDLVEQSHAQDGAWYKIYSQYGRNAIIPKKMIREF